MQLIGLFSAALGEPNQELEPKPEKDLETRSDRNLDRKSDGSPEKPEESLEKLWENPEEDSGNPVGKLDKLEGYGKARSSRASPLASRAASPSPRVTATLN